MSNFEQDNLTDTVRIKYIAEINVNNKLLALLHRNPFYTNSQHIGAANAVTLDAGHGDKLRFKRISSRTLDFENSGRHSLWLAVNLVTLEHGFGESLEGFVLRQLKRGLKEKERRCLNAQVVPLAPFYPRFCSPSLPRSPARQGPFSPSPTRRIWNRD